MPVVINELTITVDAQPQMDLNAARSNVPSQQNDMTKDIIREAVDAVMDTLRNKKER